LFGFLDDYVFDAAEPPEEFLDIAFVELEGIGDADPQYAEVFFGCAGQFLDDRVNLFMVAALQRASEINTQILSFARAVGRVRGTAGAAAAPTVTLLAS
jgi:hypothetical protein